MTLAEYFESNEALKALRSNLETNLDVMTEELLDKDSREKLMRVNLIVIRLCILAEAKAAYNLGYQQVVEDNP